jgi:hypothetical protein
MESYGFSDLPSVPIFIVVNGTLDSALNKLFTLPPFIRA